MPLRFVDLKREIAASYPNFEARATRAWGEIVEHLHESTKDIIDSGSDVVPQVRFEDLGKLTPQEIDNIKKRGCVVIRDVVDDAEALAWKTSLEEFVKANPSAPGFPETNKQFFHLYWTRAQVLARSHPNLLEATTWLNKLYHIKGQDDLKDVDLSTPLIYADRFRIRHPGTQWDAHPPHVDGGAIERWEDETFRTCFSDILNGNWKRHDPYELEGRINARNSIYGRPNQASVFRTFQGWLAMSETAPHEGTLKVFPDVVASNAYMILRPFFRPIASPVSQDALDPKNWEYDISTPDFPGIFKRDGGFTGPRPNPESHPHFRLEDTMTPVPKVYPGDMVFWHCDVVHSVEEEHTGTRDSAVMYIPAVPMTPLNATYVQRQKETFIQGLTPPDFPKAAPEAGYEGIGKVDDIFGPVGKRAMGFEVEIAS
ncbi:hypothetical protein HETIRDRAFT_315342 [Heterobasidion irregulare TC 32-1]|uniref:DUF1479-domain-containing protein n=1 Tax=Heterobasidion irregulare (strain TC 32-1) TaxID=747525 RepID=W4KAE8_HETIT|nr:uncharacterized protein HETIRDRAFT_315342 [Heterobasidion irregulare TC 32-1]ETW82782.1 hypothetical protein HETIRDRAFT_315342 [Heterobasidion irregulare TC 32-1]